MEYIAYLPKDKNSDYGVSFPDFPGWITAGSTLEEARRMAAEALAFHIEGMREDGEQIPRPSTLDDLKGRSGHAGSSGISDRSQARRRKRFESISPPAKARSQKLTAVPAA